MECHWYINGFDKVYPTIKSFLFYHLNYFIVQLDSVYVLSFSSNLFQTLNSFEIFSI